MLANVLKLYSFSTFLSRRFVKVEAPAVELSIQTTCLNPPLAHKIHTALKSYNGQGDDARDYFGDRPRPYYVWDAGKSTITGRYLQERPDA